MLELFTNTLTFPGAVVHEWAHAAAARSRGLRVRDVVLFRPLANPAGYVRHDRARRPGDALAIAIAPFVLNTVLALLAALPFAPALGYGWEAGAVVLWLSWSLALHALPSFEDMVDVDRLSPDRLTRTGLAIALTPLRLLKAGEIVGTGYLFATIVVVVGVLGSLAWHHDAATALALVESIVELGRALVDVI